MGTEAQPHTQKLEIILYGNKGDQEIPLYGKKMIALRDGKLLMHGADIAVPWTWLEQTANVSDSSLVVQTTNILDWKQGMWIAISSTKFDP